MATETDTLVVLVVPVLFELGQLVATPGALAAIEAAGKHPTDFLDRHVSGDWGDMDAQDSKMNDEAVKSGEDRVFSSYDLGNGERIWIITEATRESTCVLRPEDY